MKDTIRGTYSGKEYCASDAIRIANPLQAASYWANGLIPLDIYPIRDRETNKPTIIYVFDRKKSKPLFDRWCKKELN